MRTKGEALINKVEDSIAAINRFIGISHIEDDYGEIVKVIGGEIEKFLKSTVLNISNKNFYELIEELKNHWIVQENIDFLHNFRICYNGYKHDPLYTQTIFEVKQQFVDLKIVLEQISALNIGDTAQPYQHISKRIVWFAGWDDYIGGMTECDIFIPDYEIDMPIGIDHFNLNWKGWNLVVEKFTSSNELFMGKEHVSEKVYNFWKGQSDFVDAGAFVGDVSEFVRELSKHIAKNENDLIPFLKRDHDGYSVYCSIVFSIFDILRDNLWIDEKDMKDEIQLRMAYDYGIDLKSPYLNNIDHLDLSIMMANRQELKHTNEILWLDDINYLAKKKGVISDKLSIGFDRNFNILAKLK